MARTTLLDVRALLAGQSIDVDDVDLFRYVTTASTLVDEELTGRGLSDALLKEIEKYLAAHFVAVADLPAGVDEQTIDRDQEVFSELEGLKKTSFGQVAITLDVTGTLRQSGSQPAFLMVM
jgi:hypothetical protein